MFLGMVGEYRPWCLTIFNLILPFVIMGLFSGHCSSRSARTYVKYYLARHSPMGKPRRVSLIRSMACMGIGDVYLRGTLLCRKYTVLPSSTLNPLPHRPILGSCPMHCYLTIEICVYYHLQLKRGRITLYSIDTHFDASTLGSF